MFTYGFGVGLVTLEWCDKLSRTSRQSCSGVTCDKQETSAGCAMLMASYCYHGIGDVAL